MEMLNIFRRCTSETNCMSLEGCQWRKVSPLGRRYDSTVVKLPHINSNTCGEVACLNFGAFLSSDV